jgi:uncharacterized membrane protein YdjX (TVP38/TMEM64 family)
MGVTPSQARAGVGWQMDRRGWISAGLTVGAVALLLAFLLVGRDFVSLDRESLSVVLTAIRESAWSLPTTILLYCGLSLVGFPQALLFAATVAVFGPYTGALYGWLSTMISAAMTFGIGKFLGGPWMAKLPEGRVRAMVSVMQRRGLLTAMIVRWTPSAPFIVVNSLCGASGMPIWKFLAGTGLGIIPKIAVIAFFTEQLDALMTFLASGDPKALLWVLAAILAWGAFFVACRMLYRRLANSSLAGIAGQRALRTDMAPPESSPAEQP